MVADVLSALSGACTVLIKIYSVFTLGNPEILRKTL
jgi:hypothetical protein